jgi:hypothetical protein
LVAVDDLALLVTGVAIPVDAQVPVLLSVNGNWMLTMPTAVPMGSGSAGGG